MAKFVFFLCFFNFQIVIVFSQNYIFYKSKDSEIIFYSDGTFYFRNHLYLNDIEAKGRYVIKGKYIYAFCENQKNIDSSYVKVLKSEKSDTTSAYIFLKCSFSTCEYLNFYIKNNKKICLQKELKAKGELDTIILKILDTCGDKLIFSFLTNDFHNINFLILKGYKTFYQIHLAKKEKWLDSKHIFKFKQKSDKLILKNKKQFFFIKDKVFTKYVK